MGGELKVESQDGKGSRFSFSPLVWKIANSASDEPNDMQLILDDKKVLDPTGKTRNLF